jgi:2-C-methyl-D-erythritol 4-phosphate cytidylyltransferase
MLERIALIPAAGQGVRFGAHGPKQYAMLLGRPMLYHTIRAFSNAAEIDGVFVVLARDDANWDKHDWSAFAPKLAALYCGGITRAQSVLHGLAAIEDEVNADSWVLVHDAARPCLAPAMITKLFRELEADSVGGLLAVPVADTLKRAQSDGRVERTISREGLWQAQTPQMFRYRILVDALRAADSPTDEASAIEQRGLRPKLVIGDPRNIKVTRPEDLRIAELVLKSAEINNADRSRH